MEVLALLLDLVDGFELVALVLPEDGAFRTDFLHVHHADYLERLLVDQAELLLDLRRRLGLDCSLDWELGRVL